MNWHAGGVRNCSVPFVVYLIDACSINAGWHQQGLQQKVSQLQKVKSNLYSSRGQVTFLEYKTLVYMRLCLDVPA